MTFSRDKLVTIPGIAKHVQQFTKYEYLAGLWRKDLDRMLCWCVNEENLQNSRPVPYRAPTWPWALIDGEVRLPNNLEAGYERPFLYGGVGGLNKGFA